ncbi:hypothetical protein [Halococcus salifodinae]|nr:hypothetical protein [Halococcus salifodinae]
MQRRAREDSVELSREDVAEWYAGLRDAELVHFRGWDIESKPQFALSPTGKQVFCPACAAPAVSVREFLTDEWVLECSGCEALWPAGADAVRAFEAFIEASEQFV